MLTIELSSEAPEKTENKIYKLLCVTSHSRKWGELKDYGGSERLNAFFLRTKGCIRGRSVERLHTLGLYARIKDQSQIVRRICV